MTRKVELRIFSLVSLMKKYHKTTFWVKISVYKNLSLHLLFKVSIRKYKTEQQVECKTNYRTECNIEKIIQPIPIKVRLCRSVASKDCDTGEDNIEINGEIVCTTIYESGIIKNIYLKKKED